MVFLVGAKFVRLCAVRDPRLDLYEFLGYLLFSTVCRNVSITFFISGVHRFSFMFWSRNLRMPSSVVNWVFVIWVQLIEPYWSTIWFRNWRTGRWVFTKGVCGFVLPYVWLKPIMATFTAPQMLPVRAMPPP
jgi:hypothetical protein